MPSALQNDLKLLKSIKEQIKQTDMCLSKMKQTTVEIQNNVRKCEDAFRYEWSELSYDGKEST